MMAGSNGAAPAVDNVRELQQRLQAKVEEGKALLKPYEGKAMPAEIETKFKGIAGEIDGLKASISAFRQLGDVEKAMQEPENTPVAWRPAIGKEGDELPIDSKSWRSVEFKDGFGRTKEHRYNVPLAVWHDRTGKMNDQQYARAYSDAFYMYCRKGAAFVRDNYPVEWKALSEGVDTAGGFTVPVEFIAELIKKQVSTAQVRPLARVIQTSRDVVIFPRVNYSATATDDSGNKRFTSPVRMTWTGELPATSTTARVTDQIFSQQEVKVNTAIASQLISNDLIEDSAFDIAGYSAENMGEAFAQGEDYAFLQGTGVAQPTGIVTSASLGNIGYTASGTSADITTSSDAHSGKRIVDTFYALPAQYRRNAVWMLSSITMGGVENLVDGSKRPLISSLIGGANIGIGTPDMIKGRPVLVDEFMPDYNAANAFGVVLADFSGYLIADRVQFSVQRYTELYVETNFTLLLARKRVGGLAIEPWKFNFLKSAAS